MTALALRGLTRRYAGVLAVDAVDLDLPGQVIHALIGPNGAGKTTLFDCVSGIVAPSAGRVLLDGADITLWPPHRRARAGLARTFQAMRLFGDMTVLETVLVGAAPRPSLPAALLRRSAFRAAEAGAVAVARAALLRVGLLERERQVATTLSYGDRRRVEIARALAAAPRLLLLDEPAAGMNPAETASLADLIRAVAADGTAVLLVEHDMRFVMGLADTVTVLASGRRLFHGQPEAARSDPGVIAAYLGARLAQRLSPT